MTEEYDEKLWGKIDFLHEKAKRDRVNLNLFADIVVKYQHSLNDFSKSIENIKNISAQIIEEKDTTEYLTVNNFKKVLQSHITEFKECAEQIKETLITPIIKTLDDKFPMEKEKYTQYNKVKNTYNNCCASLEKSKKEFDNAAKLCENNILSIYKVNSKIFSLKSQDNLTLKSEERINESIANAKNLEDKYYKCVVEVNKARENEIEKQKDLLRYYHLLHTDFFVKINYIISFFIPMVKKMYGSILLSLDALEERFKKVKIADDINSFVEKYKSDLKPTPNIPFIPYNPETDLVTTNISGNDQKELEELDVKYQVISKLHKNLRDIRKDLNMEEEEKKYRIRYLCKTIFKTGPGIGFTSEEKKELISLLKNTFCKQFFLITLSKQRTKGRFKRSETLIKGLSDVLHFILDESEKLKDFDSAKSCIILSQTYYHEKPKKNNIKDVKKIYLFDYIKNYKWLKSLEFWEGIIEFMIQNEISKNDEVNKKNNVNDTPEQMKSRLSNIGFSQVLSYSNTMLEFKILKEDISKIVDHFVKKYEIDPAMAEAIYDNIKNMPPQEEDEEDEKYFLEEELKYENKKLMGEDEDDVKELELKRAQSAYVKTEQTTIDWRSKSVRTKNIPYKISQNEEQNEEQNKEENNIINDDNQKKENDEQKKENDDNQKKDNVEEEPKIEYAKNEIIEENKIDDNNNNINNKKDEKDEGIKNDIKNNDNINLDEAKKEENIEENNNDNGKE